MLIRQSSMPVILSAAAPWRDIVVLEQHRLTAGRWHQSEFHQYLVVMNLAAPGQLEWRTRYRETSPPCQGTAERSLFTIASPIWWRQKREADALFASVHPTFVTRNAISILKDHPQEPTQTLAFNDPGIESILLALRSELIDGCPGGRQYGEGLATALITRLLWFSGKASQSNSIGGLTPGRLQRILHYIDANLANDTTVEQLAARSKMSARQFARLFVQNMGVTPHQYVVRRRIDIAKGMLRNSDLSLAEIGYTVGFPTQAHFATTFRTRVGVTPSSFRKLRRPM